MKSKLCVTAIRINLSYCSKMWRIKVGEVKKVQSQNLKISSAQ